MDWLLDNIACLFLIFLGVIVVCGYARDSFVCLHKCMREILRQCVMMFST